MPYIAKGQYYTHGLKTLSQIDSITGTRGETVYCTDYNRIFTWENSWMCSDFIRLENGTAGTLNRWDVVINEPGAGVTVTCDTTTSAGNGQVLGVVVFGAASGSQVVVAIKGNWRANCDEAITIGNALTTSTTAGEGQFNTGTYYGGVFGWATETTGAAGPVDCIITPRKEFF